MLRVLIVGVLSLSVVTACQTKGDSTKSQPGVAAGKVLEVSGAVTVHHAGAARALASGETVEGDDTIETGADGHVVIELTHNLAKWELGPSKKQVVRESMAWKLAKNDGTAKAVDQDTSAAGRPAERNAAETSATARAAETAPPPAAAAAPAPAAAAAPAVAPPPPVVQPPPVEEKKRERAPAKEQAPPPPPKVMKPATDGSLAKGTGNATADKVGDAPGGGGGAEQQAAAPARGPSAHDQVARQSNAIKKCLTKDMPEIELTITISPAGAAKVNVSASTAVSAKIKQCVTGVVAKIEFAHEAATVKMQISR